MLIGGCENQKGLYLFSWKEKCVLPIREEPSIPIQGKRVEVEKGSAFLSVGSGDTV